MEDSTFLQAEARSVREPVPFCLASASPSRTQVLRAAGLVPLRVAANLDEGALVRDAERRTGQPLPLSELVLLLARAKAEAVARSVAASGFRGLVLGCDSNFGLHGVCYGKPHRPDIARTRWREMSGQEGTLASGHWLVDVRQGWAADAPAVGAVDQSRLHFAEVSETEIADYVASGEPLEVAGAFTLEGRAAAFIERVEGSPSGVLGVSVPLLRRLSAQLGVLWPQLCSVSTQDRPQAD